MTKPEIVLIAAVARNGTIGRDNELPWRLKADLQHFRALTLGQRDASLRLKHAAATERVQ